MLIAGVCVFMFVMFVLVSIGIAENACSVRKEKMMVGQLKAMASASFVH